MYDDEISVELDQGRRKLGRDAVLVIVTSARLEERVRVNCEDLLLIKEDLNERENIFESLSYYIHVPYKVFHACKAGGVLNPPL